MRRTAVVALRSQRGHLLVGHVPSPIVLGSRSLSTSADDLLQLFKQAAANKGTARDAAPPSSAAAATPKPAAAGRAKASSNHWAKKLATQLESSVSATAPPTHEPKFAWKERAPRAVNDPKHRRQALYSPVAGTAPAQVTEETRLFVKAKKRPRGPMRDTPSSLAEDTRFHDDDFDDDDFRRPSAREEKDDTDAELSFSSTLDEGGDDWEAMAAEMNAWGAKLHKTLQPHLEVINKHIRSKRVRRQKYMMFLERVIARRRANKKSENKATGPWQWPKERDYLYNTDLFIPLNLELKGIEEEGEDLHGLLTQQMEEAARAIGHNPSWPLEEKRKLMLGLKKFYEQAVRSGPGQQDIFADHRHAMDDDFGHGNE